MNKTYKPEARWVFTGELKFLTAAAIAGDNSISSTDSPVLRDKRTGKFLLPGSTIAGALRNNLHERLNGYYISEAKNKENESKIIEQLFGSSDDENSLISNIIFYDSISSNSHTEVRDGVEIGENGIAVDKAKYDFEVVPAGTLFSFRVDLLVPQNYEEPEKNRENEQKLLRGLLSALEELQNKKIRFGIKKTRGLGECEVTKWQFERYDLTTKSGWDKWLLSSVEKPFAKVSNSYEDIIDAIDMNTDFYAKDIESLEDNRERIELLLDLEIENSFIIRSGASGANEPDSVSLTSNNKPIVSGTSIAGCLRARTLDILKKIKSVEPEAQVEEIFGPSAKALRDGIASAKASPLRVNECVIKDTAKAHITRVKIDRFTGGALDTALFDEQVQVGGNFQVNLELRGKKIKNKNVGILLLLAKDLITGHLPIGGESSVGRGFLKGRKLKLSVFSSGVKPKSYTWIKDQKPSDECVSIFNGYVESIKKECEV